MLPDGSGLDVLQKIRELDDQLPVIFITGSDDSATAIEAMKRGALDYLVKPVVMNDIRESRPTSSRDSRAHGKAGRNELCRWQCRPPGDHWQVPRNARRLQGHRYCCRPGRHRVNSRESGTGKELVARALYQHGERVTGPFLAVNCAAIPEALLESELFGHERGAFTGADRKRIGKFEQCTGGTLFLDEIGDMTPVLQSKLLRVLQDQQFERVGGNETIRTNVRVIAATNRNHRTDRWPTMSSAPNLYFRLNGFNHSSPSSTYDELSNWDS